LRGNPDLGRIRTAIDRLAAEAENLDVKALVGANPWLRLRIGDWRVIYRPLTSDELGTGEKRAYLIARIVNRRDIEEAVARLG
jgi:hypothetical protein